MTEQEIIQYLKDNKTECRAFIAFPEDVKKWCEKHNDNCIFIILSSDGKFDPINEIFCGQNSIYALSDEYKSEPEIIRLPIKSDGTIRYEEVLPNKTTKNHTRHISDVYFVKKICDKSVRFIGIATKELDVRVNQFGLWYKLTTKSVSVRCRDGYKPLTYLTADYEVVNESD